LFSKKAQYVDFFALRIQRGQAAVNAVLRTSLCSANLRQPSGLVARLEDMLVELLSLREQLRAKFRLIENS
jgi:hypothetical protein